ncbi:MAG: bifunctional hydroxymethylpyrimidine kinase/phosphomethylpyrimidine kinase [Rhodospirillaceae bacterium]|jgi:hydroxymethylpyrimidine/phosphomethylpyrimidine kinase|nr:bifunctional hydroxymethylpyrimidine kinase/phosphomethylpyrimidine kinase [Rhodospirillaceae bacterium]MBT5245641.1 bifunctional hydroxymethylpyrimidine kinase/phosphomethylpyrimidine kinase [Rhodospirillaceae bacterium]MBT5562351.1 bifunctional hydroxymethylpyrimidine kinase/phosphomethylpyrimidine kinase [Rhodospirillaceae bacterium]MBT6241579.1 bifunctional hydroxymethylpyrimidine kinase/phosphomethylpyrimidine kinase [Rhodospirillaceae bacterium]MBT7138800.1 bifunctional hydroxymethylpy
MQGRVLIIAGSDSGGGAGIQADIKTVTALGGYAMTALSALTAQNTKGVTAIHEVPTDFIAEQMNVVLSDLGADAIKTGMLHSAAVIETVADILEPLDIPVVVDPVMVAKGGATLLQEEAIATMKERLIPLARVLTPNVPEACALTGISITDRDSAEQAARMLSDLGPHAVLMKGGHMSDGDSADTVTDLLFEGGSLVEAFSSPRLDTRHTHGTGCTLASAIATGLAQEFSVRDSVERARAYVWEAIRTAPGYGQGHGPLNHGHTL